MTLIDGAAAAVAAGVAEATVRTWVRRGRLVPVCHSGGRSWFRLADVYTVRRANRIATFAEV